MRKYQGNMNMQCPACHGKGWELATDTDKSSNVTAIQLHDCDLCEGTGRVDETALGGVAS